jgi:phosphoglucosamine mutase
MTVRFGTDGVRGVANQDITPEIALAIGRAAVRVFGSARVLVGRDTRRSGPLLEAAVAAGICAEGATAVLLGVVPTPAVAFGSERDGVVGVMISASHNPYADNGIKLFAPGGRKLNDVEQSEVEAVIADALTAGAHVGPTGTEVGVSVADHAVLHDYALSVAGAGRHEHQRRLRLDVSAGPAGRRRVGRRGRRDRLRRRRRPHAGRRPLG